MLDKDIGRNSQNNESLPINTSYKGVSIFYDTLKKIGYDVRIDGQNFLEKSNQGIYVVTTYKESTNFDLKEAEDWIKNGGKLVYLTEHYHQYHYPDLLEKYEERAFLYSLGKGKLLIGDIHLITNETLLKDKEGSLFILEVLDGLGEPIYFNEYHRLLVGEMPSLYKHIPFYIKVILFQLLIFIVSYILYLGKRFGKVERIMGEIERDENEYLYAAANLYEKAESIDIVYDAFYSKLQIELNKTIKTATNSNRWIDLWQKHNLPLKEKAARLFHDEKENSNKRKKESLNRIKDMDELIQMLEKRREAHWKLLKKKNLSEE